MAGVRASGRMLLWLQLMNQWMLPVKHGHALPHSNAPNGARRLMIDCCAHECKQLVGLRCSAMAQSQRSGAITEVKLLASGHSSKLKGAHCSKGCIDPLPKPWKGCGTRCNYVAGKQGLGGCSRSAPLASGRVTSSTYWICTPPLPGVPRRLLTASQSSQREPAAE